MNLELGKKIFYMNNLIFFSFKYLKIFIFEEKLVWISTFLGEKNNYWINLSL
jgi:hypothetical protein